MNDDELDRILAEIGREDFAPSPELVWRTKARLRRNALLPVAVFCSVACQSLTAGVILIRLLSSGIAEGARLPDFWVPTILSGALILLIIAARKRIRPFLWRLETTASAHSQRRLA